MKAFQTLTDAKSNTGEFEIESRGLRSNPFITTPSFSFHRLVHALSFFPYLSLSLSRSLPTSHHLSLRLVPEDDQSNIFS